MGPCLQLVERKRALVPHVPPDVQPPRGRIDRRNVVMREQIVEADRRQRVPKRLERHPVIARCELKLLEGDLIRADERHACGAH